MLSYSRAIGELAPRAAKLNLLSALPPPANEVSSPGTKPLRPAPGRNLGTGTRVRAQGTCIGYLRTVFFRYCVGTQAS